MGEGGEEGETVNYDEAVEGVEEAENPEETADLRFEELMASIQEDREKRKEQVSYDWCSTIRDAGELYRETKNTSDVGEELDLSEEDIDEALTVYRLIFDEPASVAMKSSRPGRTYFSLKDSVEEDVDEDDEPLEDLVREYVGGIYLEHDVEGEPVGEAPEDTTPPLSATEREARENLSEALSDVQQLRMNMGEMLPDFSDMISTKDLMGPTAANIAGLSNQLQPLQEMRTSLLASSIANLPDLSNQLEHTLDYQLQPTQQALNSFRSSVLTDIAVELNASRTIMNSVPLSGFSNIVNNIQIPEPVIADLSTMGASATVASVNAHQTPNPPDPPTSSSPQTISEEEVIEGEPSTPSPTSRELTTIDSVLPSSDQITTELVFETPSLVVENVLTKGDTWQWFAQLDEVHQDTIVSLILYAATLHLTANPFLASVSVIIAPTLRRTIAERQESM